VKIEGNLKSVGLPPAAENRARPADSPRAAPTAGEDKVVLSDLSSSLNKADAAIASTPAVDSAKVEEIRQAISEGRFTIDPERVADKLIGSVRQILETRSEQP